MNTAQFRSLVNTQVERMLRQAVTREAQRIVSSTVKALHGPEVELQRQPQQAPRGSWLALARKKGPPLSGRLAEVMAVAEPALTAGAAERATLTKLVVEAYPDWTANTVSSAISRLIATGRLTVVTPR